MMHAEPDLGPDLHARKSNEHLERIGHAAVGRVFQGHDPELDVPAVHFLEYSGDGTDGYVLN